VARGGTPDIADMFRGGNYFLPAAGAYFLWGIALVIGTLLLIIPGIIVAVLWSFIFHVLVDRRSGVMDSFRLSYQLSSINFLNVFVIGLTIFGLYILGICPGFCIGLLFSMSYGFLLYAVGYLMMSGQATFEPWTPTYQQNPQQTLGPT
jgi:uncharacterized membrane protein